MNNESKSSETTNITDGFVSLLNEGCNRSRHEQRIETVMDNEYY